MDFEKIKSAAEEIKLSEEEKQKMIDVCEASKMLKKKNRYVPAYVAAAAVLVLVIFSPGFLFQAKMAENESKENMAADMELFADSIVIADGLGAEIHQSASTTSGFRKIYYEIPEEFRSLVSPKEYSEWIINRKASDGMPIMNFVRHFAITREDFDSANEAYAQRITDELGTDPLLRAADCAEQEQAEIFNADIVYSFDEIGIKEYYSVPEYPFSSADEFADAVKNGYAPLSEKAEIGDK